jgi:hypothetical protein
MNFQFLGVRPEAAWGTALLSQCRKLTEGKLGNKENECASNGMVQCEPIKAGKLTTSNHPEEMLRNE